jgi:hypothetical protein
MEEEEEEEAIFVFIFLIYQPTNSQAPTIPMTTNVFPVAQVQDGVSRGLIHQGQRGDERFGLCTLQYCHPVPPSQGLKEHPQLNTRPHIGLWNTSKKRREDATIEHPSTARRTFLLLQHDGLALLFDGDVVFGSSSSRSSIINGIFLFLLLPRHPMNHETKV